MTRIYLVKRLEFKGGVSLNPHTPYPAVFDEDRNLWVVSGHPVLPKFVEKVVDNDAVLA
jgi:hypothetical protein